MDIDNFDFLNIKHEPNILNYFGNEKILFSDNIKKFKFGLISRFDNREIIITNRAVYFYKKKEIKRRVKIEDLYGITYSSESNQFVVHLNENDYDYLLMSEKREKNLFKYVVSKKERRANPYLFKLDKNELTAIKDYLGNDIKTNKDSIKLKDFEDKNNKENKIKDSIKIMKSEDKNYHKDKLVDNKILKFKDKNNIYLDDVKNLKLEDKDKNKIKETQIIENNFKKIDLNNIKNKSLRDVVEKIMQKDNNNNINIIYPEDDIKDIQRLITLYFVSGDQSLKCAVICNNNEIF